MVAGVCSFTQLILRNRIGISIMTSRSLFCAQADSKVQFTLVVFIAAILLFTGGCGDVNGVRGTITLDGEPLKSAWVQFTPLDKGGRIATGQTGPNGSYGLKTSRTVTEVFPGKYKVAVTTGMVTGEDERGRMTKTEEKVPEKYNAKTELEAVVKEGANEINFELTN
jgi:hypothetical protein